MKRRFVLLLLLCIVHIGGYAKITLPGYFTDNMVLQQQTKVLISGQSSGQGGVELRVGWNKKVYKADIGTSGEWSIEVETPKAGGPYDIVLSDGEECFLHNVLIGEVWLCSGQSNMEMPLAGWGKVMNYEKEIAEADYPSIRLFQVKKETSLSPRKNLASTMGGWKECSPAMIPNFSAVGYFFARNLWKDLNVPVGVIDCTWGGTPAEGWASYDAMKKILGFSKEVENAQALKFNAELLRKKYDEDRKEWQQGLNDSDRGYSGNRSLWTPTGYPDENWGAMSLPGYWENKGMSNFDGIVWFRKTIDIPADWSGKQLKLRLSMIDDEDITYFNGVEIARGYGYNSPREYIVPAEVVKVGKAVITVRVSDFGGEGGIHGQPEDLWISCGEADKIPLAGEWRYKVGVSMKEVPRVPLSPVDNASYPAAIYNAMVNPLIHFPVKGVIWYQGEANVGRATEYADLFQSLIQDWRDKWQNPEMPFYFVQLASYLERKEIQPDSEWAALREAQNKALHLCNTGMAVAIDIGDANDIHPKKKQEVGRRLSLLALQKTYGKGKVTDIMSYKDYVVENDKVRLIFEGNTKGFQPSDLLTGFTIAGADHVFYPAKAQIKGNELLVWSPDVSNPVAVRYGWADNPDCNLYDRTGFPVAPFRTDCW